MSASGHQVSAVLAARTTNKPYFYRRISKHISCPFTCLRCYNATTQRRFCKNNVQLTSKEKAQSQFSHKIFAPVEETVRPNVRRKILVRWYLVCLSDGRRNICAAVYARNRIGLRRGVGMSTKVTFTQQRKYVVNVENAPSESIIHPINPK